MSTARRLYLYGVSAVALTLLCLGASKLLQLVFGTVAGRAAIDGGGDRETLALALALLLVGLPLWLVHWWLVERSVRSATPAGAADRRSELRALYLAIVAGVSLFWATQQTATVLETALRSPFVSFDYYGAPIGDAIAAALVGLVAWAFHAWTRHRDTLGGPLTGAAAWWSRLYLYGAMLAGALTGLRGASVLIQTVGHQLLGTGSVLADDLAWPIANGIGLVVVGSLVYAGHSLYARRLTVAPDWRREAERASKVRGAHDVVAVAVMAPIFMYAVADALRWLLAIPLDVEQQVTTAVQVQRIIGPVATMLPFAIGAVLCSRSAIRDAGRFIGPDALADVRRQVMLVLSTFGLAFTAVGVARTLGLVLEQAFGPAYMGGLYGNHSEIAQFAAIALTGLPVWLVAWAQVERRGRLDRAAEARSTARRAYLLLVLGLSVTAAGLSSAFVAYQVIRSALGIAQTGGAWQLSQPIAIAVVGVLVLVYHGWVLRSDMAVRASLEAEAEAAEAVEVALAPPAAAALAAEPAEAPASALEQLVLVGPPGADVEPVNELLREHLPTGWSLRVVGVGGGAGR